MMLFPMEMLTRQLEIPAEVLGRRQLRKEWVVTCTEVPGEDVRMSKN